MTFGRQVFLLSTLFMVWVISAPLCSGFSAKSPHKSRYNNKYINLRYDVNPRSSRTRLSSSNDDFSFGQRIESTKALVVGAVAGGVALTPFSAIHNIFLDGGEHVLNGVAQWEFDTDMGSVEAGLFAIVYRYCVREDKNPMLKDGVVGAFALVRILSKIQIPIYCSAAPLSCGAPLEYFDWDMLSQAFFGGLESLALFGAASAAMEYCFKRNIISKFRG